MLRILKEKMLALGRGEEGVAMVVTLGIFMFLYVACASVYAVGWAVKEKMHLQAACDAAAYSAAIVQADTFSRIATINRAMSWTYQQMTRRQMDYIVWQWLEETAEHFKSDRKRAEKYAKESLPVTCRHRLAIGSQGNGWNIGWIDGNGLMHSDAIRLNETKTLSIDAIESLLGDDGGFADWLRTGRNDAGEPVRDSFYSQGHGSFLGGNRKRCRLGLQIDDDLRNIRDMSRVVASLAKGLPGNVTAAVSGILAANVPQYMRRGDCQYFISQDPNPHDDYFETFDNTPENELIFLSLGDKIHRNEKGELVYLSLGWGSRTVKDLFGTGIDDWFELDASRQTNLGAGNRTGIHRHYDRQRLRDTLKAVWSWWSTAWTCQCQSHRNDTRAGVADSSLCGHLRDPSRCACRNNGVKNISLPTVWPPVPLTWTRERSVNAVCRANNGHSHGYDNRFGGTIDGETVWARPLRLKEAYFGPKGTITVGLARRSENPWFSLLGRVGGGIYSAFSPISNSWSFCFASAKAGYKLYHLPKDFHIMAHLGERTASSYREDFEERYGGNVRAFNGPRDYCVDWKPVDRRFADWEFEYDEDGNVVRDEHGRKKLKTIYVTETLWRTSWNLVQDDWDAVMVPVRQGGSTGYETSAYSLQKWWEYRLRDYARNEWRQIPYRYEPVWRNRNDGYLATLVREANWRRLSGVGVPDATVQAGPRVGTRGDPLSGRLAGQIWEDHWRRGIPPPQATGTSLWNIGNPGQGLNWNRIGEEMYH